MTYSCSYCQKVKELTATQRFNIKQGKGKNPTCSVICRTLMRIELEKNKDKVIKTSNYYYKKLYAC